MGQGVADMIRLAVDNYGASGQVVPTVLEIPSKEHPYDPRKDSIMQRVAFFMPTAMVSLRSLPRSTPTIPAKTASCSEWPSSCQQPWPPWGLKVEEVLVWLCIFALPHVAEVEHLMGEQGSR